MEEEVEFVNFYKWILEVVILYKEGKVGVWSNLDLDFVLKWCEDNYFNKVWLFWYNDEFENVFEFLEVSKVVYEEEEWKKVVVIVEKKWCLWFFVIVMGIFGMVCLILVGVVGWVFYEV